MKSEPGMTENDTPCVKGTQEKGRNARCGSGLTAEDFKLVGAEDEEMI